MLMSDLSLVMACHCHFSTHNPSQSPTGHCTVFRHHIRGSIQQGTWAVSRHFVPWREGIRRFRSYHKKRQKQRMKFNYRPKVPRNRSLANPHPVQTYFLTDGVEVAVQAGPLVLVLVPAALEVHGAADGDQKEQDPGACAQVGPRRHRHLRSILRRRGRETAMLSGRETFGDCRFGDVTTVKRRQSALFRRAPRPRTTGGGTPATSVSCHPPSPPFSRTEFQTNFVHKPQFTSSKTESGWIECVEILIRNFRMT